MWRIGNEKQTLPRIPRKKLPRNSEITKNLLRRTDRARPLRIDELSMQQGRNPTTVCQLLTQIQDLQNKVNSLADAREF